MDEPTVTPLREATAATCGGKAAALATLLREGLPVPDGFVVPFAEHGRAAREPAGAQATPLSAALRSVLAERLAAMGDPVVAVRSSAANEDTAGASAAGQYESVIGVRGPDAVAEAVRTCWASARSARVTAYWRRVNGAGSPGTRDTPRGRLPRIPEATGGHRLGGPEATGERPPGTPAMAVLVQRLIDADVAGVMFTPSAPGDDTRIEASRGLGLGVVGGAVTPGVHEVGRDGTVTVHQVPGQEGARPVLDDDAAATLAELGERVAAIQGRPQDIEWAIADGQAWILQARPITAPLPALPGRWRPRSSGRAVRAARAASSDGVADGAALSGVPGAHGVASGIARVLHSPSELGRVRRGDILVCRYTEPAWTPAFGIAGGIVTETGGVLSHAAIVAREHGIPAVLGVPRATTGIRDGTRITVDGTAGTVIVTAT